jgi:hypothetical protein
MICKTHNRYKTGCINCELERKNDKLAAQQAQIDAQNLQMSQMVETVDRLQNEIQQRHNLEQVKSRYERAFHAFNADPTKESAAILAEADMALQRLDGGNYQYSVAAYAYNNTLRQIAKSVNTTALVQSSLTEACATITAWERSRARFETAAGCKIVKANAKAMLDITSETSRLQALIQARLAQFSELVAAVKVYETNNKLSLAKLRWASRLGGVLSAAAIFGAFVIMGSIETPLYAEVMVLVGTPLGVILFAYSYVKRVLALKHLGRYLSSLDQQ